MSATYYRLHASVPPSSPHRHYYPWGRPSDDEPDYYEPTARNSAAARYFNGRKP